ncbi:hypothetical protein ES288_D13G224300v1 [Gossypium darwinii]|uniref:Uncharacterized protein n=2 Tax=Gossypium TaxID=3633 RepID=A0A5D2A1Y3_GOSDA|nr:hypothetical protein ES288_D13G224300v1 [Gossypium darwinii]
MTTENQNLIPFPFYSGLPKQLGSESSPIDLKVSPSRIDFAPTILPASFLTTRPDAGLWFCESNAASKKMALFALCIHCLGLVLVAKIPHSPQQNPMHCSFVPFLNTQISQLHISP